MSDERTPEVRLMVYMEGYQAAVAFRALRNGESTDPDFSEGWTAGRADKKAAYQRASEKYGAVLNVLRIQDSGQSGAEP
ncbi:MAG: hypothetical protein AB7G11_02325 [Phycisphaerales bacterium]